MAFPRLLSDPIQQPLMQMQSAGTAGVYAGAPASGDFWGGAGVDAGGGYGAAPQGSTNTGGYTGTGTQGMGNFGSDPYAYSGGSLLTPWTQQFVAPTGPSYSGISLKPFSFGNISYSYTAPGAFTGETDITPTSFGYNQFQSAAPFQAPTAAQAAQDPGYQFRLQQGQQAMQAQAAASGLARTGGFAKAMSDYNQNAASQEYQNVYNRAFGEYQNAQQSALQNYQTKVQTQQGISQDNWNRMYQASQANNQNQLAAYQASTNAQIQGNQLGWDIASGSWDRNFQAAQAAYQSAMQIAQANASAGASNANLAYDRALQQYQMNYGIFQNNQQTQWDRQMQLAQLGMQGQEAQAGYGSQYAGNMGDIYGQSANAGAAGITTGANAWANALSGAGSGLLGAATAYYGPGGAGSGGGMPGTNVTNLARQLPR